MTTPRTDPRPRLTLEAGLYALIAVLAAALRIYHLGGHPLNEAEAREALAAFRFLQGDAGPLPLSPAYASLTTILFLLLGSSEAIARLTPALAGVALVLTPALFKRDLGRPTALIASALLAISPTLIASSRTAGGQTLAALALALALAGWLSFRQTGDRRWFLLAAGSLGAGLASGPAFFTGVAGLVIGWAVMRLSGLRPDLPGADSEVMKGNLGRAALVGIGTLVGVGALGLIYRPGLGGLGNSIVVWAGGFRPGSSDYPLGSIPLALVTYELLSLVFGAVGLATAWFAKDGRVQAAGYLAVGAYLFVLLYPGRAVADLAWVILPWAPVAASLLARLVQAPRDPEERWALAGHVTVVVVLAAFMWLNLADYARAAQPNADPANNTRLMLVLATLGLIVVITALFAAGWARDVAARGLGWGAAIALGLYTLGAGWGLAQLRPAAAAEIWNARPVMDGLPLLVSTVNDVSNRSAGTPWDIDVVLRADRTSAMGWAFRGFPKARFVPELGATIADPVVIAPLEDQSPALGSAYVGQSFAVTESLPDSRLAPDNWIDWLVFRNAEVQRSHVVLWVRQDVQGIGE